MKRSISVLSLLFAVILRGNALAVPETVSVRVTDVTPSSFAVVWMTDVEANPEVEIFGDAAMQERLDEGILLESMPEASDQVAVSARQRGIMKVRATGLTPATTYYVRTVSRDMAAPDSIGYSSLQEVTTAEVVKSYRPVDGVLAPLTNDLLSFRVYIRPGDPSQVPGLGDLVLLETGAAPYPISAFVGEGIGAPEGVLDLNNLFGADGATLDVQGGEKASLRIYRGGSISTLLHYRKFAMDNGEGSVSESVRGFFADFNLDGVVDAVDFDIFKSHYRNSADDFDFNPDVNLIQVQEGGILAEDAIDARDFAKFATEYGNTEAE